MSKPVSPHVSITAAALHVWVDAGSLQIAACHGDCSGVLPLPPGDSMPLAQCWPELLALVNGMQPGDVRECMVECQQRLPLPHTLAVRAFRCSGAGQQIAIECRIAANEQLSCRQLSAFHAIFDQMRDGAMLTDARGRILDVNPAFCRVTGYSRGEAIGHTPRLLQSGRQSPAFYDTLWQQLADEGVWQGELWNRRKSGEAYLERLTIRAVKDAGGRISHYIAVFYDLEELRNMGARFVRMTRYDNLTGLSSRQQFIDSLPQVLLQAGQQQQPLLLAHLDLDRFSDINQEHGALAGDQVLVELSARLKSGLTENDRLARLSGDDFVMMLSGGTPEGLTARLETLHASIEGHYWSIGHGRELRASVGGVIWLPQSDANPDGMMRQAFSAMLVAKQEGGACVRIFDHTEDSETRARHALLEDLRRGLFAGELVLYYQPKVDLRHATVIGAEALIRWQHPERGLLSPMVFMPLAENSDLIIKIGRWVLERALMQLSLWNAEGLDLVVSVNLSARELHDPQLVNDLKNALERYPLVRPGQLEFEILESAAIANMERTMALINDCRELGVRFALDDFGTGYSSLAYLKSLNVDTVKIDQLFVRDLPLNTLDQTIVRGIVTMVDGFGRSLIAEGAESAEHMTLLQSLGCHLVQGYGIARPMPADDIVAWVNSASQCVAESSGAT